MAMKLNSALVQASVSLSYTCTQAEFVCVACVAIMARRVSHESMFRIILLAFAAWARAAAIRRGRRLAWRSATGRSGDSMPRIWAAARAST